MTTQELIEFCNQRLNYNPDTGIITWKSKKSKLSRIVIGSEAGRLNWRGYREINVNSVYKSSHRLAFLMYYNYLPEYPEFEVDHINNIKDDNRIINLRISTKSQNSANKTLQKNNKSGYRGVYLKQGKWCTTIRVNQKKIHLGLFSCKHKAASEYNKAAHLHFGEFAYQNTIKE